MPDVFLQGLLNEGHLRDIGGETARFDALTSAVQDLSTRLVTGEGRGDVVPLVLVGLDEKVVATDPVFAQVEAAIVAHWSTYGNVFHGDRPRQLLRMVALAAVHAAAESDDRVAAAAWYTASNWLELSPQGSRHVTDFALSLGAKAETRAIEVWARPKTDPSFRMPARASAQAATVERFTLTKKPTSDAVLKALSEDVAQLQLTDSRMGTSNDPSAWVKSAAPELAAAILSAVESGSGVVIDRINEAGMLSAEGIKDFAEDVGNRVREALADAQRASAGRELRSELLWWRQALYSPSLRLSYRALDPGLAALAMAVDLHTLVPDFTPHSLEFVLREAVRACEFEGDLSLAGLVDQARAHRDVWAGTYQAVLSSEVRRTPALTAALSDTGRPSEWLGPAAADVRAIQDVAVWAFRELQAARLVAHA